MDLIKQAQNACLFPEFREEERRLVSRLAEYSRLLPEPSARAWLTVIATWLLLIVATLLFLVWRAGGMAGLSPPSIIGSLPPLLLTILGAAGAVATLNTLRMSQLRTPEILAVQEQITMLGGRVSALFHAYRRSILHISEILFRYLETCLGVRNRNAQAADEEIHALFEARRPDAIQAKRNQRTKTRVPRESDYTIEQFLGGSNRALAALGQAMEPYDADRPGMSRPVDTQPATIALQKRMKAVEKLFDMECRTELRILRVALQSNHQKLLADLESQLESATAVNLVVEAGRLTRFHILDPVDQVLERLQAAQDILLDTAYARDDEAPGSWTVRIAAVSRQVVGTRRRRRRNYRMVRIAGGWIPLLLSALLLLAQCAAVMGILIDA